MADKTDHKLSNKKYFGSKWHDMPEAEMNRIVAVLADPQIDEDAIRSLAVSDRGRTAEGRCPGQSAPAGWLRLLQPQSHRKAPALPGTGPRPHGQRRTSDSALHAAGYLRRDELLGPARDNLPPVPDDITNPRAASLA